jgi:mycothiol system anti-sigma-R factor
MSCGKPHEVDCAEILDRVYVFLDGEAEHDSVEQIRQHLDECAPCLRKYDLERAVKALVHRSCGAEHAPERLREKVLLRIRQVQVEITEQFQG